MHEGENLVIMGKSGSGKSVMIKCLIGLEIPDSGSIKVMERKLRTQPINMNLHRN
jgi:phospholipid/cholesterol/gamma-HCH transport system ATP-binding protein